MKCDFCGHEVAPGTVECPYCHYQFKIDAQVLSPEERDTFEGVTIDESAGKALYMTAVLMLIMKDSSRCRRISRYIPLAAAAAF